MYRQLWYTLIQASSQPLDMAQCLSSQKHFQIVNSGSIILLEVVPVLL